MNLFEIIEKKAQKQRLNEEEISFMINGFQSGLISDYQFSAFLMAILINGLDDEELFYFTREIIASGKTINLSKISGTKIDKHSTGGVGDKISLIIGPIFAALGYKVAKMSGRGLGFTGGTIDKLESIPGFRTQLTEASFLEQVQKIGLAITAQSKALVPADKKIYALRDVTGTVSSIPLIASSIMSKKIATGADIIVIDVKCGSGAFMNDLSKAKKLANKIKMLGKKFGKKTIVKITNMEAPLGKMVGNKNEIIESLSILQGSQSQLSEFANELVAQTLSEIEKIKIEKARQKVANIIESGKPSEIFLKMVAAQGGNLTTIQSSNFWIPAYKEQIFAPQSGYIKWENALIFGKIVAILGGGRTKLNQKIDYEAGICLEVENGTYIQEDQLILSLYSSNTIDLKKIETLISKTFSIKPEPEFQKMFLS
ncbi:thymidine phosphorylase [Mycoplasma flocculare]|uniref:Thymidine phosphorylase n=2 Tax=Mesomycoplasma flocculare TaxID=2128 RepID=A0A0A8E611_MESFC|nr:thymidine phosphorylase [Mesomycoplasma flocculare]MXR39289.1 thymidine phosphorylase [Mycoplasma sp. MF12]AJC49660.1 thymidine phosphorylase [Mesomycoplasma flocculare ATCC 27399]ENX50872.1 thymidine phosphorylase [Mesomycoplasma flocculare ATCC 27716]MXR05703.1 thymidine phosphorylase [Mesomycoplasma flocculare]MXR12073.1 thymidine phosphorylase [Mesomycoplasma flocculare]